MNAILTALLLAAVPAANETPGDLVRAATARVGFPPESYPVLPSLSTEVRGRVCDEIAKSALVRGAYEKLDVAKRRNVDWFEGVAELEKQGAVWCLQSCLCHPSQDVQIHALRSLERLKDKEAVAFLVLYAEYMAVGVDGSENATIHGVIHESLAKTLSALTGVEVALKGQDEEGLKKGIKRWRKWLVLQDETGRNSGGDLPAAAERDPEETFHKACERLVALEAKNGLLKGASEVKPVVERDENNGLKSADLVFARNAAPPGKGPAKPKDASEPFVYVSVQVWSGRTQQPPGNLHEFEWKGQTYQMWVRVFGSDSELVKAIRVAVDEPLLEPPAFEHPKGPVLRLQTSQPLQAFRKGRPLVFEGLAAAPIHRPGPEHFKVTRVSDAQAVSCNVAYDRDKVEQDTRGVRPREGAPEFYVYDSLFKGTRLFLYNGAFSDKDPQGQAGVLDLYGRPELEAGVRYRLTWACWPVGASNAVEVSCEFELSK